MLLGVKAKHIANLNLQIMQPIQLYQTPSLLTS
jgi:hypothetical protein